ncbi:PAP/fibrillin family protein [Candidatus Dependentiae bacterium]|nr:PAP/fibrillin family protein [Candidatus Dependentiae bacterium]
MHAVASAPVRFAPIARVPAHRRRTSTAVKPGVPRRRAASIAARASSPKNASQEINAAKLSVLVDDLRAASGDANGTDLTEEDRSEVESILSVIESLCPTDNRAGVHVDGTLAGTDWELIYTDSAGNSSGKLGPFVGKVKQVFKPTNGGGPGTYTNVVELFGGVFTVKLDAVAEVVGKDEAGDKLKVTFVDTSVWVLGAELFRKPFPEGRSGTWVMKHVSETLRVLRTNQGNVFALGRVE